MRTDFIRPSPPTGGSGVPSKFGDVVIPIALDISILDLAQQKADKLKATLLEVQELIRRPNIEYEIQSEVRAFVQTEELIKKICTAHEDANIKIKIKLGY